MYSMETIVNNTALFIGKSLREWILKVFITQNNFVNTFGDGC